MPSVKAVLGQEQRLTRIFDYWKRKTGDETELYGRFNKQPNKLVYELDHQYEDAKLRLACLQGHNKAKALAIEKVGGPRRFTLLFANIERSVHGDVDSFFDEKHGELHTIDSVYERDLQITPLVDKDGNLTIESLKLEEADIVQGRNPDQEPDDEDYDDHHGVCTHTWNFSAMVIVPGARYLDLLFSAACEKQISLKKWLYQLLLKHQNEDGPENRMRLYRFCAKLLVEIDRLTKDRFGSKFYLYEPQGLGAVIEMIAKIAAQVKRSDFIHNVATLCGDELPFDIFPIFAMVLRMTKVVRGMSG